MQQGEEVQSTSNNTVAEGLAKQYGIKGVPLLSTLSSLSFPLSFPYDFMHLIWQNLIPNLIRLWTGSFKDLNHNNKDYVLKRAVWKVIGKATAAAGKTIPAAFGSQVPNLSLKKPHMTAEMYSIWTLYLTPALLKSRFKHKQYYKHFVKLVQLLTLCLEFEITHNQIDDLEKGFQQWVQEYKQLVFLLLHKLN